MTKTKYDETYIFEISMKIRFFDVSFSIKIPFFRVLFTFEPGRSLLQFVTTNCLITSRDFNVDIKNTMSTQSQIFWGCISSSYCLWPKNDKFSYIGLLSSTSNLNHIVALFDHYEAKVLKEGLYSEHLPISAWFQPSPPVAQNTQNQNSFPTKIGKICQVSPSVKSVTRC